MSKDQLLFTIYISEFDDATMIILHLHRNTERDRERQRG